MSEHVDCRQYFECLSELIDGEMDRVTADRITAHLKACPQCRVCWATFRKSVEIFRNLGAEPLPVEVLQEMREYIKEVSG